MAMARKVYILALTIEWDPELDDMDYNADELVAAVVDNSTAKEAIGTGIEKYGDVLGFYSMGEVCEYR